MVKFHTRFDVAECKNKNKVYDRSDNVDRLSYVDSSLQVQQFIQAGHNLAEARARALKSGAYSFDESLTKEADANLSMPVYESDPVIVARTLESVASSTPRETEKADAISDINQAEAVSQSESVVTGEPSQSN